jgi:N-acetyl sugar amidotransferase
MSKKSQSKLTINKENLNREEKPVFFCKKCVVSNQRPRITFDEEGVCNACNFAYKKHHLIDWAKREKQLRELCDRFRRSDGKYDCIVPGSGGKDSAYVAWKLKYEYNMHPLTVTFAPAIYTDVGWQNLQQFIHKGGFDNILSTPNRRVHKLLTRYGFEKLGDPFEPFVYGVLAFPIQMAVKYNIPLVVFGENGEAEYGGVSGGSSGIANEDSPIHDTADDIIRIYFSGIKPEDWLGEIDGLSITDLWPYMLPEAELIKKVGIECHFFSYYSKWVPQEHYYFASEYAGFKANPDGRSEGTYSKYASLDDRLDGIHYYMSYTKFGLGRATSDAAHEIRDGHITREEAAMLVRRYDGEFPKKHFKEFLAYADLSEDDFWKIVDGFRPRHLWDKTSGEWKLKYHVS